MKTPSASGAPQVSSTPPRQIERELTARCEFPSELASSQVTWPTRWQIVIRPGKDPISVRRCPDGPSGWELDTHRHKFRDMRVKVAAESTYQPQPFPEICHFK